jgi:hypothetical protein
METRKQILTELQEIAPFLERSNIYGIPYALPPGYFEDFAEILMNRIRFESAGFSENVKDISSIREITEISSVDETTEISSLLAGLQNKNPYQVPEGYFEKSMTKILQSESIPSKLVAIPASADRTKRISIPIRMVRYAAAACIAGLIGIAAFNITHPQNMIDPIKALTAISDQDMANYLDADDIHWTPGISSSSETASVEFNDNDIHDLLSSVPDDELEQYSSSLQEPKGTVN